jgi:uncharacterized protein
LPTGLQRGSREEQEWPVFKSRVAYFGQYPNCLMPEKHDVSQAEAEQIFFNAPLLIVEDARHSVLEVRLYALGRTDAGRPLHISFTLRGDGKLIRVISVRAMHRKERLRYEQES